MEAMMAPTSTLTVGVLEGTRPRLIRPLSVTESLDSYRAVEGYAALPDPEQLLAGVDESGLLGRGGAAFPLGVKLTSVRDNARRAGQSPIAVANGEEGEPASVKDRWLLRNRPHLVLDGLRLAAHVVGAERCYVYVSDDAAARALELALDELRPAPPEGWDAVPVEIVTVRASYIAGEETAAVRVINGGPAKPTDKPPRPFEAGVAGRPTLVSNVETLANLPFLHREGAPAFRSIGSPMSPGTFLATVTGAGREPGLYELPHGTSFGELLNLHQVPADQVHGVLMGGYFAGLVNRRILDTTLDHETLRRFGTGLGCGAVAILTETDCAVAVAASVMRYYDRENAGQCGSCFNGTAAMSAVTEALRDGVAEQADLDRLTRWSVVLRSRGACGTLDGATNIAASLLQDFPEVVARHLAGECAACDATAFVAHRPFEVEAMGAA